MLPQYMGWGLRFLKQNVPEIEILEYPTWAEYESKLGEGWDVVGFSFFLYETAEAVKMASAARRAGIKELWAGNYGALTPGVVSEFDRIFIGYAEDQIAQAFGRRVTEIVHPPLFIPLHLGPIGLKYKIFGVLFTQRGCAFRCRFCQSPLFCPKPYKISLESVERVLAYYRHVGVREVLSFDENFGGMKEHTEAVVDLLHKYGIWWHCIGLRAQTFEDNLAGWKRRNLASGWIGFESLNQSALNEIDKRQDVERVKGLICRVHEANILIAAYYMLGFESDTEESIRRDVIKLARLGLDYHQLCVVTPLPRTPLWYEIDRKYGIFDYDWGHYDAKHLVWHHPHISPPKMAELLDWAMRTSNPPSRYGQFINRLVHRFNELAGSPLRGWRYTLAQASVHAWQFDARDRDQRHFLRTTQAATY